MITREETRTFQAFADRLNRIKIKDLTHGVPLSSEELILIDKIDKLIGIAAYDSINKRK